MSSSFVQLVQAAPDTSSATTVATGNFSTNPTAGNLIFAAVSFDGKSQGGSMPSSITVTDTLSNTYTLIDTLTDSGNEFMTAIFYAKNIAGGAANAVTAHFNGTGLPSSFYKAVMAAEYSGLDATTPFVSGEYNGNAQEPSGSGTDNLTSNATPALSAQPALVIGFSVILHDTSGPPSAGTGFTQRGQFWQFSTGTNFACLEDKRVTATTAVTGTFTPAAASNHNTYVAVFHEASGGGGTVVPGPGAMSGGFRSMAGGMKG